MMFTDWLRYFWEQLTHPWTLQPEIFNLPWLYVALQPLRLLGKYPALAIVQIATLVIVVFLSRKMEISWPRILLILTSAPVFSHIAMGQIDGLILLAFLLPPLPAAALVLCKPQTALWAGWEAFRAKPVPVILLSLVLVASAFIIWRWPLAVADPEGFVQMEWTLIPPFFRRVWNWTFFPWAFLAIPSALKKGKVAGMFLSPFLFPYAALNSLIGPIIAAATTRWYLFGGVWLVLWLRWAWMNGLL